MKILQVITGLGMGGAENVVVNLSDSLAQDGHQVKIAYLTGNAVVLPKNADVEVVFIGLMSGRDFLRCYFKLRRLIVDFRPDVVHSHMVHANIISRLLRLTIKIPRLITTAHSSYEGGRMRMIAYRVTDFLTDVSTNVSASAVKSFVDKKAVPESRMVLVSNGIDVDKFKFSYKSRAKIRSEEKVDGCKVLLAVGRLDRPKDYPTLLRAIARLKRKLENFKLLIVGDGPLLEDLEKLADTLNVKDKIKFLGLRSDVNEVMAATDVFVLSSAWEGFGLVVAEAMACGRYVVATDCGGVSEIVDEYGALVKPGDDVALSNAIEKACKVDEQDYAKNSCLARAHIVNRFSLHSNVEKYYEIYLG
ncbi:glycosyltransferase [Marinobacter fonticola]|uniref:glycosyltransferase n=1 Tax=Marinobacter fonticola TaxID=2603215 RepID=UPI0011E6F8CA|nr:glycosyltransferase [Marinobacter fonticola]